MSHPTVNVTVKTETAWRDTKGLSTPELWEELETLRAREIVLREVIHARVLKNPAHRKTAPAAVVNLEANIDPIKFLDGRRAASQAELRRREATTENIAPFVGEAHEESTTEPVCVKPALSGRWNPYGSRSVRAR
jgi:hypothetical protein